jgi:hypothetical protein
MMDASLLSSTQKIEEKDSKSAFSPYLKFTYALNAPESKRQYPRRF